MDMSDQQSLYVSKDSGLFFPPVLSILEINGDSIRFNFTRRKPCLWWRFWQWLLLGWRWFDA